MKISCVNAIKSQVIKNNIVRERQNTVSENNYNNVTADGLNILGLQNFANISFTSNQILPDFIPTLGRKASCELERSFFETVHKATPDYIIEHPLLDLDNKGEITFTLKKEHLDDYDAQKNPEGLGLQKWFDNYKKEARVSTAGIRGNQNVLYPWDTREGINQIGIMLATQAKAMAAKNKYGNADLHKLAASEVRYNSDKYVDIISRIQAANGITTHVTPNHETIPIWMASFLSFKEDLLGGEYVTSSHGISAKIATKDLNDQGSQYLPEESMEFVDQMEKIFADVRKNGSYDIKLAPADDKHIKTSGMEVLHNGVDLYSQYLRDGVASNENLELIKSNKNPIYIESVGGSAYRTLSKVLGKLDIDDKYKWFNTQEDPFFHQIGKTIGINPKTGRKEFMDYSVDVAIVKRKNGKVSMPVIETMNYDKKLANAPIGTVILMTDPDHDRLSVAQIESSDNADKLKKAGVDYMPLGENSGKLLTVYTPNQSFLMTMDFHMKQLKAAGKWDNHPRFIIKTTASAMAWDEWAKNNNVKVVNTPVGFKELANIMKKVEKQIKENPTGEVKVKDVYGKEINLGVNPRLVFAGEESGGMIIGPEELISSKSGRKAIAMREKSATEAIVISSALVSSLSQKGMTLSDNLQKIFDDNKIKGKYDIREDVVYYNEAEPDPIARANAKKEGEVLRTKNDLFYLALAMAKKEGRLTLEQGKEILSETFQTLNFDNLKDIKFVGDGTYLEFTDKYIEIRPSGTDAKTKAYGAGIDKDECIEYAKLMGNYGGERNGIYKKYISDVYYNNVKENSLRTYNAWAMEGTSNTKFEPPCYAKTAGELVIN